MINILLRLRLSAYAYVLVRTNFDRGTVQKLENGNAVWKFPYHYLHVELLMNVSLWREYPDCIQLFAVLNKANCEEKPE